jgi:hypothetical protein
VTRIAYKGNKLLSNGIKGISNFTTENKGSGQIVMVVKELSHHNREELFLIIMCQAVAKDELNM